MRNYNEKLTRPFKSEMKESSEVAEVFSDCEQREETGFN